MPGDPLDALTPRERAVLAAMAEGKSNIGIAETLFVSEAAVEKHVTAIFRKLAIAPASTEHRRVHAVLTYINGATRPLAFATRPAAPLARLVGGLASLRVAGAWPRAVPDHRADDRGPARARRRAGRAAARRRARGRWLAAGERVRRGRRGGLSVCSAVTSPRCSATKPTGRPLIVAMHGADEVAHVMHVGMRLGVDGDGIVQRIQRTAQAARIDTYTT